MERQLLARLDAAGFSPRGSLSTIKAGDTMTVYRLETEHGAVIAKHDEQPRLTAEAKGLEALRKAAGPLIIPQVLDLSDGWLLIEALDVKDPCTSSWRALGEGLQGLHRPLKASHGWSEDNYCGATPQRNAPLTDGRCFQRERRLTVLMDACYQRGLLSDDLQKRITDVAERLEQWLPDTAPSLIHGDLWSGNLLFTPRGPALIDPAVYRHYPEVDLAMLSLFGSPPESFYDAYWNGAPADDWQQREALFQLYPLLNHLLLFGSGYHDAIKRRAEFLS